VAGRKTDCTEDIGCELDSERRSVIEACRSFKDSISILRHDGFLYLHVSPLLPSMAEERKGEWWVQMIEERIAVNTKLVAAKTTLLSPEVFRLWTSAYGGCAAARCARDMEDGLMDRDAHHLLNVMLAKPPASTGNLRLMSGFAGRRLTRAMDILQRRGWLVAASQDCSRRSSMISFLWTTSDDWWGDSMPNQSRQDRTDAWRQFIHCLAVACKMRVPDAERLLSWLPVSDLVRVG